MTTYLVPAGYGGDELTEKRSRFIGQVWAVEDEAEARTRIEETKKKYYDARHNCWCYILREGGVLRYSDDGEPQGTAGQPMLNVFRREQIENVCCTVTRYFGGILLGAGGLVRAYSAAAKLALDAAGRMRMASWTELLVGCSYAQYEQVRRLLETHAAVIEHTDFGADVVIEALVRADRSADCAAQLTELTAGTAAVEITGELFRGVKL